ncbi:GvpL/GvpF family gas vesicle protein [Streptomyces sp. RS10V-4]|uniref:GvpL/GvpF family gas vesicle protein n=1 Tax=Streptomyces rhizoryzae TaxID=2932493 RepID=UPI002003C710|nr:GvpL/GvpF family gas vesicle protein [Streptomyces rhizoryzae]MCK7625861.1 GvpL/GvpF family gas vesicle protein [Streptomyces rhizoryzae]
MTTDVPAAPATATMSYVYAVGRAGPALDAAARGLAGPADGPLRTVASGPLAALVSSVPADAYGEEGLRARLADLTELAALARAHHAVVDAAYARTTVLPLRLATVYLDDARVRAMLDERGPAFAQALGRLEGQVELGVKVYADPRAAAAAEPEPQAAEDPATAGRTPPEPGAPGPGRAYLRQRRQQRRRHQDAYRAAGAVAAGIRDRVATIALDRVAHRPQQGELAGAAGENIANDAYLVPARRVREFRRALAGAADGLPGVRVELTGPWAPYSFATPPPPAAPGEPR